MSTKSIHKNCAHARPLEIGKQLPKAERSVEPENGTWKVFSSSRLHGYIVDWQIQGHHCQIGNSKHNLQGVESSCYSNCTNRS